MTAALCDRAASTAAREHGIPLNVLQAISRVETGRLQQGVLQPWPWAVNMEGEGRWFENADAARAYVFKHFKAGARSFDVGCFQINYLWHGDAFRSIDAMFDPLLNARYAAKFLKELYQEFDDWPAAAGAYHSRTPRYARSYTARFSTVRDALALRHDQHDPPSNMLVSDIVNPPFIGRGSGAMGSLVPIGPNPLTEAPVRPAFVALN
ncbi:transglycosylase SLT domain-containing protein [Pontibaca salina]|uniref:Transglycosylase SLT domain-containing protein n=1 Tax=Pontibaca salina TaxID=2795731 RepID=A0A934LY58_9RHOB|nr:transglycosylase SLT domain-containing protein [Pontibaca salina]MBI6629397.1 transglycosylase SLT domain-containing protein [Pontibaca salina]